MSPQLTSRPLVKRHHHDSRAVPQILERSDNRLETLGPQRKLNTGDAAVYSSLARSTLEKLRVFGGGPNYIKIGRRVL